MKYQKYMLLSSLLFLVIACKSPQKEELPVKSEVPQYSNPFAYLGSLTAEQDIVKNELIAYLRELKNFNTDAIVAKTYPALFTVINETHFREYISTMMNSKDIMVKQYETHIDKIGKVKAFSNGTQFAQVDYTSDTKIIFLNDELYNTSRSINFLYDVLVHKYGKENIRMNVAERTLEIKRKEKMLVIKEENQEWKFIGDTAEYRRLYPSILPYEIISNLDQ